MSSLCYGDNKVSFKEQNLLFVKPKATTTFNHIHINKANPLPTFHTFKNIKHQQKDRLW